MNLSLVLLLFSAAHFAEAQPSFVLQLIGSEISEEKQSKLKFCETKYCLSDADYLFTAATQNKSVEPCDDFREFALGSFIKYRAISDRRSSIGFVSDSESLFILRLKKVLEEKTNANDTRVTTAIKKLYVNCVNADSVRQNGVSEMREYLRSFGLTFYPEKDQDDFVLSKYFEEQPYYAITFTLWSRLSRTEKHLRLVKRSAVSLDHATSHFSSYKTLLYDMFKVHLNNSNFTEGFKEDFRKIADAQFEFYKRHNESLNVGEDKGKLMSVDELNDLTAKLNLDWSKIINNQMLTKLKNDEKIYVESPETLANLTKFLVSVDQKAIADYVAYHFLLLYSKKLVVYTNDEYAKTAKGLLRSDERWEQCTKFLINNLDPALNLLYSHRYADEKLQRFARNFITDLKLFTVKKIRDDNSHDDNIKTLLTNRINAINVTFGYPKEFLKSENIEKIYSHLPFGDENSLKTIIEIVDNERKILLEPAESEIRVIIERADFNATKFSYSARDDSLFIHFSFIRYPFYHYQRPRFFNSATVGVYFFRTIHEELTKYLEKEQNYTNFDLFCDEMKVSYEFYDDWLKSGGNDMQIGAHRLTDQMLFWMAAAAVNHVKKRSDAEETDPSQNTKLHEFFYKNEKFREAFNCNDENL